MSVKKEASGRRSVQTEFEVRGTPEQVWQAIATSQGMSSWFVPTDFDEKNGKPVAITVHFGPGIEPRSDITAWDPPRKYATQAAGWMPGSPAIASEWSVEARGGGKCVIRIVQSLFASTDEWDAQLDAAKGGFASFLEILKIYLAHFRGQRAALKQWSAPAPGTEEESWDAFTAALGLKGRRVGDRVTAPAGVPAFSGVLEYATEHPFDALVRLEQPAPGIAALGIAGYPGEPLNVAMHFYLYGDQGASTLVKETPLWDAWLQKRFPAPAR